MKRYLKIHNDDNVVVALEDFHEGEEIMINSNTVPIMDHIPFGHKMTIYTIEKGHNIVKYGMSIGHTTGEIKIGRHVHSHNLTSNRS